MQRITYFFAILILVAVSGAVAQTSTKQQLPDNSTPEFRLSRISLAIENFDSTVKFYEKVFGATLTSFEINGYTLYTGEIFGMEFLLIPNKLARVDANNNRCQFDIIVTDLESVLKRVTEFGGEIGEQMTSNGKKVVAVLDPDGNQINLLSAQ